MKINFQEILDQYKGNLRFERMTGELNIDHESLYMIETNRGSYFIFETDYIDSFDDVVDLIKKRTESYTEFVEVDTPFEKFEDTSIAKYYTSAKYFPADFEDFKKYVASIEDSLIILIKK